MYRSAELHPNESDVNSHPLCDLYRPTWRLYWYTGILRLQKQESAPRLTPDASQHVSHSCSWLLIDPVGPVWQGEGQSSTANGKSVIAFG